MKENDKNKSIRREKVLKFCNRYAVLLQLVGSFVLYFLIESMSRHSFS